MAKQRGPIADDEPMRPIPDDAPRRAPPEPTRVVLENGRTPGGYPGALGVPRPLEVEVGVGGTVAGAPIRVKHEGLYGPALVLLVGLAIIAGIVLDALLEVAYG